MIIPLVHINKVKNIIRYTKNENLFTNHDFIKQKDLIDKNINEENSDITEEDIDNEEIEEDKSKNSKENTENLNE